MEENEIDVEVIEREEEGKPRLPDASKRKIIFVTAISLFVFLVAVASISTFIALSVSLSGNDNGESESNDVPAPSPSPSSKPSPSSNATPSPSPSSTNLHLPQASNSPLPTFSRPQNDPVSPMDLDAWYGNDGIEEGKDVPPEPSVDQEPLRYTAEYQLNLRPKVVRFNRTAVINEMLGVVTQFTGLPFVYENGSEAIRNQYTIDGTRENCTSSLLIRVRDYITGPKTGGTTVDIKGNSGSKIQGSIDFPFFPGPAFPDSPHSEPEGNPAPASFQKVEKDVHDCSFKYSRETRIFFEHPPAIETCHDLLHLYPWVFPNLPKESQGNKLTSTDTEVWWVLEHSAYLVSSPGSSLGSDHPNVTSTGEGESDPTPDKTGIRCESTFTLQYNTLEEAFNDGDPYYGEWSLRIYRTNDGLGSWDPIVVATVDNMYQQMIQYFDPGISC